jgi:hypothetical protein
MTAGGGLLTIVLNLLEPAPAVVFFSIVVYTVGASSLIARYCLAHEDEIPVRRRDPDPR